MEQTNILVQIQNLNVVNINNSRAEQQTVGGVVPIDMQELTEAKDRQIKAQSAQFTKLIGLYQELLDKYLALKEEHSKLLKQLPAAKKQ